MAGRPPTPTKVLDARGSWRAKARRKAERTPAAPGGRKPRRARWKPLGRAELEALVREIPGFNPFADVGGCRLDVKRANEALAFFPEQLCHIEGAMAGRPFRLERWQQAVIANLFGWVRWSAKWRRWVRRFRECLIYVPRKNGKTPLVAGVGIYMLMDDAEQGQQDYLAAHTREQAGKLFRYAKGMLKANPALEARCRIYGGTAQAGQSKSIVKLPEETSFLQVIAAEADAQHGGTAHLLIIEELHTQPDRELVDTLGTSMASENRAEPLMLYVTTADFARESICNEKHDYARKVRDGVIPDPAFLPVVYEAGESDDWRSEATWRKVNPNLGVSVSLDYLRRECEKAKENPELENTFRRLHTNQKTEADVRGIPSLLWEANGEPFDEAALDGRDCYCGLDLANTLDVAALAKVFPPRAEPGPWHVLVDFWVPEWAVRGRETSGQARYAAWAARGHLHKTDGDVIDYTAIRAKVAGDARRYRVVRLNFDPWNATQLAQELQDDEGVAVEKFVQSLATYNEPWRKMMELLKEHRLCHGGHPVLAWMAGNVTVHTDGRGYKMPSRKKSADKIDGVMALLMGLGGAIAEPPAPAPRVEVW